MQSTMENKMAITANNTEASGDDLRPLKRIAAPLLIVTPIVFDTAFSLLSARFDYPQILRRPAGETLARFAANEQTLSPLWAAMFGASLTLLPTALFTARAVGLTGTRLRMAETFGTLAALTQALGLSRWVFLTPTLAQTFVAPDSTPTARETAALLFDAFNRYAGNGIGEWMGYLFTGLWTLLIVSALWGQGRLKSVLAVMGALSALGILSGTLESLGVPGAGLLNAGGYILWALWLISLGVVLGWEALKRRPVPSS